MTSSSATKMSLKLLIDTNNEKVLYAEASKSVIDFLFNLLRLPFSAVVKLLSTSNMVGCIGNLYESVENLDQIYMQPNQTKDVLLNLGEQGSSTEISGFLTQNKNNDEDNDKETKLYMCPNKCKFEVTNDDKTRCKSLNREVISSTPSLEYYSSCSNTMSSERLNKENNSKSKKKGKSKSGCAKLSASSKVIDNNIPPSPVYRVCGKYMSCEVNYIGDMKFGGKGATKKNKGFVKDDVTYMVMDDLQIHPMSLSTISSTITLLNNLNVQEVGTLEEKFVEIGMDEVMKLLEASLQSKMVLTSVFIKSKKGRRYEREE